MSNYDLTKILPHNPPMILLDDVIKYNEEEKTLIAEFSIYPEKVFFNKKINGINSLVGIEFMAQAIGCYSYFKHKQNEPKKGLLLGTRLFNNAIDYFKNGETYKVFVHEIFTDNEIVAFDCQIFDNNKDEIESACIKAFQADNIEEMFCEQ